MPRKKQQPNQTKPKHGDGSVYEDKSRGGWIAQIYVDGRSIRRRAATAEAAEAIRKELVAQRDRGINLAQANQTLETFLNTWFNEVALQRGLKPTTVRRYVTTIEGHILPYIGKLSLQQLKPVALQRWINTLKQRGLSSSSISIAVALLGDALKTARRWSLLDHNPLELVDKPQSRTQARTALTVIETRKLLDQAREHRLYALFYIGAMLGLRAGELLGLHWRDINLDEQTIKVVSQSQYISGQGLFALEPKTRSSARTIAISDTMAELLKLHWQRQQRERLNPNWKEHGLVFPDNLGQHLKYKRVIYVLGQICKQAGIRRITMHILRHTTGTRLAERKIDRAIIEAILGHSKQGVTSIYVTVSLDAMRAAVTEIEGLYTDDPHTQSHTKAL